MKIRPLFAICMFLSATAYAPLAAAESGLFCHGMEDEQPQDRAQLAEITTKSYFFNYRYPDDWNDNPKLENGQLRQESRYLIAGDRLVVGPEQRGYRCGYYINGKGIQTANWIKADTLRVLSDVVPADWRGVWVSNDGQRQLKITARQAEYQFIGGGSDPGRISTVFPFSVPASQVDAQLTSPPPTDAPCKLKLHRLGEYLIITNGESCGLMNANPDGVLRKR
ncbi:TPA: hypothetical protein PPN70_004873 [Serratia rubidaea]|nr:hypothetical protein [Serratia rubidaea]HDJ1451200.1 hypothetical protein [Serratia rubidaea]HDJ1463575.1 hypothetical protein [Serratia rubidaea]HDJ2774885.1 hypothetical protein [Serratia rubidaea]